MVIGSGKRAAMAALWALLPSVVAAQAPDALSCALCHHPTGEVAGVNALRYAPYPQIAGLPARYIERQLHAYRAGERAHALMGHVASTLSDDEIATWARAYASADIPQGEQQRGENMAGFRIATEGIWARGVPSCDSCHAADTSRPSLSPPLVNFSESYIHHELRAYAEGARDGGPMNRMAAFASRLTDEEMSAVAAYYGNGADRKETAP